MIRIKTIIGALVLAALGLAVLTPGLAIAADEMTSSSATAPDATASTNSASTVMVLQVDGIISPPSSDFIIRGLQRAAQERAALLVIELDTPGGLDSSMRSIVRGILASPVPVATFVAPGGARAASAGTFILYASHVAAMTPASNLGAATPVSIGGGGASPSPEAEADKKAGGSTMMNKATNDAAAYLRSLAQLRERNADFAERTVREASSLPAQEALKAGVIDLIASDTNDLLQKIDGRTVKLEKGESVQLATAGATIVRIAPDWRTRVLSLLANPQIALILMMVGIYGLFFELTSPGIALPGVAGLICILLGLYAFQMLPVNWAGVALAAAGAAMMIAEAFLPSFGILGLGGIIAFILGGLFLTDTGIAEFDLSIPFLVGFAISCAGLIMLTGIMVSRARNSAIVSGREQMLGLEGVVTNVLDGTMYAELRGESWRVRSKEPLSPGDRVRVVAMDGLTLQVTRAGPAPMMRH
ncbi:serine protease [Pollutimonas nitritireducens]|uniref:Serine protease n=1 Tax=Pollutimonas nitritireducens TaxID=2045209 RepID=A0A2N4UH39_9BURK|nr:nodulation protein NfeD [Pollutimonas nitritireducens]PLC54328.1 serine protease [Pollutimonas nitritireducens]